MKVKVIYTKLSIGRWPEKDLVLTLNVLFIKANPQPNTSVLCELQTTEERDLDPLWAGKHPILKSSSTKKGPDTSGFACGTLWHKSFKKTPTYRNGKEQGETWEGVAQKVIVFPKG